MTVLLGWLPYATCLSGNHAKKLHVHATGAGLFFLWQPYIRSAEVTQIAVVGSINLALQQAIPANTSEYGLCKAWSLQTTQYPGWFAETRQFFHVPQKLPGILLPQLRFQPFLEPAASSQQPLAELISMAAV